MMISLLTNICVTRPQWVKITAMKYDSTHYLAHSILFAIVFFKCNIQLVIYWLGWKSLNVIMIGAVVYTHKKTFVVALASLSLFVESVCDIITYLALFTFASDIVHGIMGLSDCHLGLWKWYQIRCISILFVWYLTYLRIALICQLNERERI